MKLCEYKLEDWDNTYKIIALYKNLKIVVLDMSKAKGLKWEGIRNLVAIDNAENIIWIAEPPKLSKPIGFYDELTLENGKLKGWYGGSTIVTLSPENGEILSEDFVK